MTQSMSWLKAMESFRFNFELITDNLSILVTLFCPLIHLPIKHLCLFGFLFVGISDGDKRCSCYSFINDKSYPWIQVKDTCGLNNNHLVVMETEREWKFINKEIQTLKSGRFDEWLIGLYKNATTGNWTWINGKPLTIDKWQVRKPQDDDLYAMIAKEWPKGHKGSFNSIKETTYRGWICEKETGINTL